MLQKEKKKLISTITSVEEEVSLLNSKLENMIEFKINLKNGSNMIDEILEVGQMSRNMKGKKNEKIPPKKLVLLEKKTKFLMVDHMSQHRYQHVLPLHKSLKKLF